MPIRPNDRFPLSLLALLALILGVSALRAAAGFQSWALEVVPGLVMVAALAAVHRRFPMSRLVQASVFLHLLILNYGGFYTYAKVPLGEWMRDLFHLHRNHYDRIGHFALGFFPAILTREILLRKTPLVRGFWLSFIVANICLSFGAFWELIEWWTTLLVAGDVGDAFLGSQGDIWDAQWDMFLVLVGAVVALLTMQGVHDRSLARLERDTEG